VIAVGETGVGKTWFSLYVASEVAKAGDRVLFVELEGTGSGFQDRLKKVGLESKLCHLVIGHGFDLLKPNSLKPLLEEVRRIQPRLIVFDCFVEAFSGVENDAGDVTTSMKMLKSLQNAVCPKASLLLLHHTGKSGADAPKGQYAARGSSVFDGAADAMLRLTRLDGSDSGPQLGVTMTKAREFARSSPMKLQVMFNQSPAFTIHEVEHSGGQPRERVAVHTAEDVALADIEQLLSVLPQKSKGDVGKAMQRQRKVSDIILAVAIDRGLVKHVNPHGYVSVTSERLHDQLA